MASWGAPQWLPKSAAELSRTLNFACLANSKGVECCEKNELQAAVEHFNWACRLDRRRAAYVANRAAAHLRLGDLEACIQDCKWAVMLGRKSAAEVDVVRRVHMLMGEALAQQERLTEACTAYRLCLAVSKNGADVQHALELLQQLERRLQDGDSRIRRAWQERDLGCQSFTEGRYSEAVQHLTEALQIATPLLGRDVFHMHHVRAECHLRLGRWEAALADAEACIQLAPTFDHGYLIRDVHVPQLKQRLEAARAADAQPFVAAAPNLPQPEPQHRGQPGQELAAGEGRQHPVGIPPLPARAQPRRNGVPAQEPAAAAEGQAVGQGQLLPAQTSWWRFVKPGAAFLGSGAASFLLDVVAARLVHSDGVIGFVLALPCWLAALSCGPNIVAAQHELLEQVTPGTSAHKLLTVGTDMMMDYVEPLSMKILAHAVIGHMHWPEAGLVVLAGGQRSPQVLGLQLAAAAASMMTTGSPQLAGRGKEVFRACLGVMAMCRLCLVIRELWSDGKRVLEAARAEHGP